MMMTMSSKINVVACGLNDSFLFSLSLLYAVIMRCFVFSASSGSGSGLFVWFSSICLHHLESVESCEGWMALSGDNGGIEEGTELVDRLDRGGSSNFYEMCLCRM